MKHDTPSVPTSQLIESVHNLVDPRGRLLESQLASEAAKHRDPANRKKDLAKIEDVIEICARTCTALYDRIGTEQSEMLDILEKEIKADLVRVIRAAIRQELAAREALTLRGRARTAWQTFCAWLELLTAELWKAEYEPDLELTGRARIQLQDQAQAQLLDEPACSNPDCPAEDLRDEWCPVCEPQMTTGDLDDLREREQLTEADVQPIPFDRPVLTR